MTLTKHPALRPAPGTHAPAAISSRGRWLAGHDPEDEAQWNSSGRAIAHRNLWWSILTEFLGFVVWQLWAITVVFLPEAGFQLTTSQSFWLISLPSLVGATLRVPYTFMVGRFGGRNWTIVSGLLLLVPTIGLALVVGNPATPFWVLLLVAATAGLGGGNFASSMANISFFFPAREKGWALGLNAAGGNLGAAVAQFTVPIVISVGAAGALQLPLAGWIWVPLVLVAAFGAWRWMDNLTDVRGDLKGALAAVAEPHFWILSLLYIGTFGSFIGFCAVFPKLIADTFPQYSTFTVGAAALSLAFLGPLVGSLARPWGGRVADRFGGARMTVAAFGAMSVLALGVIGTLPMQNFWLFLGLFLLLFIASGIGNGATYRMIPAVFRLRGIPQRAAAALGLVSAVGGYGGFIIPQVLSASKQATDGYEPAFAGFIGYYLFAMALCWAVYLRRSAKSAAADV